MKIGKVKFSSKVDENFIKSLQQNQLLFLKSSYWNFTFAYFNNIDVIQKLLKQIQQSECSRISIAYQIGKQYYPKINSICKNLAVIKFSQLKTLYLVQQTIETIQFLGQFQAPLLQRLYVYNNTKVTNLKILKKIALPFLSILNIQNNPVVNFGNYLRFIKKQNFECIILQSKQNSTEIILDLSSFVKCQFLNLQRLRIISKTRINQPKVIAMLAFQRFQKDCNFITK